MSQKLISLGKLEGHNGWVTAIATPAIALGEAAEDFIVSSSRDKSAIVWAISRDAAKPGVARRRLHGHNHFVQDVTLSKDGQFALTASWDKTLRLWRLATGECTCTFVGHTADVMAVAFSPDNRQIVSASRDKSIRIWNSLGECKITLPQADDWVSCVRYSPSVAKPVVVSGGWDSTVRVWDLTKCDVEHTLKGHTGYLNALVISPDGSIAASAGKDGVVMLWDLPTGRALYNLTAGAEVSALAFSPNRFWLSVAVGGVVRIFDLENNSVVDELACEDLAPGKPAPICCSIAWSANGERFYAGYTDFAIRVWQVISADLHA